MLEYVPENSERPYFNYYLENAQDQNKQECVFCSPTNYLCGDYNTTTHKVSRVS